MSFCTEAQFLVPDWGYEAGYILWLSYRPGSLCSLTRRYDNPMSHSQLHPQSGSKNMATGLWSPIDRLYLTGGVSYSTFSPSDFVPNPLSSFLLVVGGGVFHASVLLMWRAQNLSVTFILLRYTWQRRNPVRWQRPRPRRSSIWTSPGRRTSWRRPGLASQPSIR